MVSPSKQQQTQGSEKHRQGEKAFTRERGEEQRVNNEVVRVNAEAAAVVAQRQHLRATAARYQKELAEQQALLQRKSEEAFTGLSPQQMFVGRRNLQDIVAWTPVPHNHSCQSAFASVGIDSAAAAADKKSTVSQAELELAWLRRHSIVTGEECQVPDPGLTHPRPCRLQNFCVCSARGRSVAWCWSRMQAVLKQRFQGPDAEPLVNGEVCLLVRGRGLNAHNVEATLCHQLVYVPLHYMRPWRPTFLSVQVSAISRVNVDQLEHVCDGAAEERHMVLECVEDEVGHPVFLSPFEMVDRLDLQCELEILVLRLSTRRSPLVGGTGKISVCLGADPALHVWAGADEELRRRRRRGAPDFDVGEMQGEEGPQQDEAVAEGLEGEDFLEDWEEVLQAIVADTSSDDSTSSSSESSSSTSTSRSSGNGNPEHVAMAAQAPEQVADAPPHAAAAEREGGGRQRRPESFQFGPFKFTFKPPSSFQALCPFHSRRAPTRCTKVASWRSPAEMVEVIRHLKLWCLRCQEAETKEEHQQRRGLPAFTDIELALTEVEIDGMCEALPDPLD